MKKQWMLIAFTLIGVVLLGLFFLPSAKSQVKKEQLNREKIKPLVEIQTIKPKDLKGKAILIGQTVPEAQVDIAAKYSGRVKQVKVELGQVVATGQALIVQDTGDIDLTIAQNAAAKDQAQAEVAQASANYYANYQKAQKDYQHSLTVYRRYQTLYEAGAVSHESLDSAEQQMISAKTALDALKNQHKQPGDPAVIGSKKAEVVKAEKNMAALQKQRDDLILRAPRSGVIAYRQVEEGTLVQPGQTLLSIIDASKIYVDCQLSEQEVAHLFTGMEVKMQIDTLGSSYPGEITYISPAGDPKTKKFAIRITLTRIDNSIKGGMFARSQVDTLLRANALCVPKEAVLEKNGEYYLLLINKNKQVEKQSVQLGLSNDTEYEVLEGIKPGDRIITSNLARLKAGMSVEIRPTVNKQEGKQ